MKRIKTHLIIFLLSMASLLDASAKPLRTVAFAQDTMANDFRRAQVYEMRDALAARPDIDFIYSDANGQTSLLIRQIEQFISARVDLLVVGTNHADAVIPVIEKAYSSGIPLIILDRGVNTLAYTTFINSDNIRIGQMGADYVAGRLGGRGQVLLFEGLPEADVTQLRSQGFLKEIAKNSRITVIRRTGNYLRKDAIIEMEKLIKEGVRIDAIFSESDSMLSGVRSVLQRYDIDPASIVTVGCDYTSEAREAILSGKQTASILFSLGGKEAADIALKILAKEKVPKHISIPVRLITRDNADKVPPIF